MGISLAQYRVTNGGFSVGRSRKSEGYNWPSDPEIIKKRYFFKLFVKVDKIQGVV